MKILITRDFLIERNYKDAFESLGHEVLNYQPTEAIETIHQKVATFNPSMVFCHSPWDVTLKQMCAVKNAAKDSIMVFATHEDPMEYHRFREFVPLCDYHFTGDRDCIQLYQEDYGVQAHYLPVAANSFLHFPVKLEDNDYLNYTSDLAFVGNNFPNPERVRSEEKMLYPFLDQHKYVFKFWGGDVIFNDIFMNVWQGRIAYEDINKAYSGTKIALGVSRCQSHEGYLTMRYFEAPACGCFFLADYCKGLEKMFKDGEHIVFVRDEDDVVELVDYYLENEEEREKIAQQGRAFILKHHTYQNRVETILRVCGF